MGRTDDDTGETLLFVWWNARKVGQSAEHRAEKRDFFKEEGEIQME